MAGSHDIPELENVAPRFPVRCKTARGTWTLTSWPE